MESAQFGTRLPAEGEKGPVLGSWPEGFLERTFGCLAEDPLVRGPLLQHEAREKLILTRTPTRAKGSGLGDG